MSTLQTTLVSIDRRTRSSLGRFRRKTFSSLRVRNYRLYFIGQGISLSGTWMQVIGQSWLVLKLTGSGTALGLVTALQFLPVLLLAPVGGVLADRFSKRRLLFATQAAAGVLALVLGLLVATGAIALWMLYPLALALGVVNALDNPTRQAFVHELVGGDRVQNAVALNSVEINLTRIIGPAVAGAVIAWLGLAPCFLLNAASYVAVLACLLLMDGRALHLSQPVPRAKGQLREGLRYVSQTPVLRDVLVMMALVGTFTFEFMVMLPLLARFTFHRGADGFALLQSAMGIGAVAGGLVVAGRGRGGLRALMFATFGFAAGMVLVAVTPTLATAALAMVGVGAVSVAFTSLTNTILQLETAPEMRSRVLSLWTMAFLGSAPIGGPVMGWIGEHAGPREAFVVGAAGALLAGVVALRALNRKLAEDRARSGSDASRLRLAEAEAK